MLNVLPKNYYKDNFRDYYNKHCKDVIEWIQEELDKASKNGKSKILIKYTEINVNIGDVEFPNKLSELHENYDIREFVIFLRNYFDTSNNLITFELNYPVLRIEILI